MINITNKKISIIYFATTFYKENLMYGELDDIIKKKNEKCKQH